MSPATLLVCLVASALSAPVPKAKPSVLEIAPFVATVRADDPVDLLMTFRNNTGADIVTKGSGIEPNGKAFRIEAKHENDKEFTRVRMFFYERSHDNVPRKDATYPAGQEFVVWWTLTGEKGGLCPFPKAGEWEVRAILETTDGPITSPKASIKVTPAPKARPAGDADGDGDYYFRLALSGGGGIGKQHFERVRELAKLYPDTYRETVMRRAILLAEYIAATTAAERTQATGALKEHCKDLPAHIRDMMYLLLAFQMVEAKEYDDAAALIAKMETAYDVSYLRKRIQNRK
jgi:hypothetical protein